MPSSLGTRGSSARSWKRVEEAMRMRLSRLSNEGAEEEDEEEEEVGLPMRPPTDGGGGACCRCRSTPLLVSLRELSL